MTGSRSERPLRLAFLGDPNSIHTRRWAEFFASRGHEIHLLVPDKDTIDTPLDQRFRVHTFRAWPRLPLRGLGTAVTMLALRRALLGIRPDVLHAHYLTRYGWAARLSGFRPYVVTVWGSDVFVTPRDSSHARVWARRTLSNAALVTAVSADLARAAIELGAVPARVRLVQFGVDPQDFKPGNAPDSLRADLALEGRRVVLSPRALRPNYQHEVAIRATASLPDDVTLLLVDWQSDAQYRAQLVRLIDELDLGSRVRFLPPIPHEALADYYRLSDVVVSLPSTDAFPVTALEAMACGTPIVMGELPSAHEGLDGVDGGAIVPGDDVAAVAAAIRARLELAPPERAALAERLRARAIERGDMRRNLLEMEELYRGLATKWRSGWRRRR
jgi:glycosyltransferase involved in cell wall biosynthesis